MIHIDTLSSVYRYQTDRKAWKNNGIPNTHVLSYQLSGQYDHTFGSTTLETKTDTLFFIPKATPYAVQCKTWGTSVCVSFSGEVDLPPTVCDCSDHPEIKHKFLKLLSHQNLHRETNYCEAASLVYALFAFLCKRDETVYLAHDTRCKMETAHAILTERYTDPSLKLPDVAKSCGMSDKYFRVCFKKKYNLPPSQYLISLRLQTAARLLTESDLSVSEIASQCGFCDVYYFSKLFKQHLFLSPTDYRLAHR